MCKLRWNGLVTSIGERGSWRRSVYVRQRRKEMPTVLETFDLPQMNPACQDRPTSTVAQQALYLMNNAAVRDLSHRFADHIAAHTSVPAQQIELLYLTALSRPPSEQERRVALSTLLRLIKTSHASARHRAELDALAVVCHTIMNSAAFLYID